MKYIDLRERTKEDILKIVMEKNIEIERLNNKIQDLQADYGNKAQVERDLLKEENKRLNNIIKEVREYIEQPYRDNFDYSKARILEILDKGE